MAYLSKETILKAYKELSKLTNDPSSQGSTQVTSSLRYILALDEFYQSYNRPCDTASRSDKDEFIKFVGNVVSINNGLYTSNFYDSVKDSTDYSVGSNFYSVNTVKTSLENPSKEFEFPKRGKYPLFVIQDGKLIKKDTLEGNISAYLPTDELKAAFCLWLVRYMDLDSLNPYVSIENGLKTRYSEELVSKILPDKETITSLLLSFSDDKAELKASDFPKSTKKISPSNGILPSSELSQKVREGFIRYWEIIDQHGAQIASYVSTFERTINEALNKLELGYSEVFEIVNPRTYESAVNEIVKIEPSLGYLKDDKAPNNEKYQIWSTNRHYKNYLEILAASDFFSNIRQQNEAEIRKSITATDEGLTRYLRAMRTKPFLLLAGISGTGKSRIVKQLAYESCPDDVRLRKDPTSPGNYCLVEVKPNWHDSTELLGYESQIGKAHYVATPFIKFLVKAMLYPDVPFYVCLDEMNLAPVEQYFAEFLSVLESRKKIGDTITSEPLIDANIFRTHERQLGHSIFGHAEPEDAEYTESTTSDGAVEYDNQKEKEVYELLKSEGLRIPPNVVVVGTVNMDETTHQFSRKVIDRAMTIEMNIAEGPKPFEEFFTDSKELSYVDNPRPKALCVPDVTSAMDALQKLPENHREYVVNEVPVILGKLNDALDGTPFKIAYRVQNELVIYYAALQWERPDDEPEALMPLAVDDILMMKVLPRIEGDESLLGSADIGQESTMKRLAGFTSDYPKSREKVNEMSQRLERNQFTSFWP